MIGVARSLVSGEQRFPEGPTHMLPLLMRALPGVDPNDFSKCMVRSTALLFSICIMNVHKIMNCLVLTKNMIPVTSYLLYLTDHIPVYCYICDSCAFGGLFVCPAWKNWLDRGELVSLVIITKSKLFHGQCKKHHIFGVILRWKERCALPLLSLKTLFFSLWTGK